MSSFEVGQVLAGKLLVEGVLGKGGMGLVLVARHTILNERVAVKLLRPDEPARAPEPAVVERFYREARAAARLKSDHITRVMDVGALDDGSPYIVMEHLDGETLSQRLKRCGPMPVSEAVDLVLQTCEGLAEAHSLGIIHRDLKPSNLMVVRGVDGLPLLKILDFGIAKATLSESATLTGSSVMLGSPSYASPEQIRDAHRVDGRTDVWSLGVTLYEMLANRRPFEAYSPAGLIALISVDPPTPIRDLRPDLPLELQRILLRCLEKSPDHRYPTVADLAADLAPFASPGHGALLERIQRVSQGRAPLALAQTALASPGAVLAVTGQSTPPASPRATGPKTAATAATGRSAIDLAETQAEPTLSEQAHSVTSSRDGQVRYSAPEIPLSPRRPLWGFALVAALVAALATVFFLQGPPQTSAAAASPSASSPTPAAPSSPPTAAPAASPSASVVVLVVSAPAASQAAPTFARPLPVRTAPDTAVPAPAPAPSPASTSFATDFGDRK